MRISVTSRGPRPAALKWRTKMPMRPQREPAARTDSGANFFILSILSF